MSDRSASISPPSLAPQKPAPSPAAAARTKLLLEGPILPTLLRLAAPNVLTLLAFAGVITFDGFFLGRIGTNALAGASLAFPWVMMVLQTTNSGMGIGVSSAIARALGAGRRDRTDALVFHAFLLALAVAAIFSTVFLLGAPFMFQWMGGRDEMLADALAYANVALGGAVVICMSNLLGNAVRGTGNMSFPAAVLVGAVIVHIAISPVLIFGFGPLPALGSAGAGWGLVIPFAGACAVMIWYLRSRAIVRLNFRGVTPSWELFADILKVGVPGLINIAITNLSVVVLTGIAGQIGRDTALGYAMGARLEYIMQPIAFGFGSAMVAMVGTNWGAQQYRRAREIAWTGAMTVAVVCGTIGLIVAFQPGLWIGLFSDDAEVARLGTLYLRIVGPAYLCFGLGLGLFYICQGVGRGVAAMNANAVRMITSAGCGAVAIYWLDLGTAGFFAAVAAGFCVYAALLGYAVFGVKAPVPALATSFQPRRTDSRTKILLTALAVFSIAAFPLGALAQQKEIKIGFIYDLTGPFAASGSEAAQIGTKAAIDMFNENGGVEDYRIKAIFVDAQSKVDIAINEMTRLIDQEKVDILSGLFSSAECMPIAPQADARKKFTWLNICVATEVLKDRKLTYVFRPHQQTGLPGAMSCDYINDYAESKFGVEPKNLKVAIIYEDSPYGTGVAAGNESQCNKHGIQIVLKEGYSATAPDLSSLVAKLKRARPDVLLHTGYYPDVTLFLRQAKEQGLKFKAVIGHGAGYSQIDRLRATFGDDINYFHSVESAEAQLVDPKVLKPGVWAMTQEMIRRYQAIKGPGEPPPHASMGFNNTWILLNDVVPRAIRKYGGIDSEALRKAALDTDIPMGGTMQGYGVKFYPPGQPLAGQNARAFPVITQYVNGQGRIVWPKEMQTADPVLPFPKSQ